MNPIRPSLRLNGAFSIVSGVLLTAAPTLVNRWLGVDAELLIRAFGVVLLAHGLLLFWSAAQPNPEPMAFVNVLAIAPYPLAMLALVVSGLVETPLGRTLILADGVIIAAIATWQWRAVREHRRSPAPVAA